MMTTSNKSHHHQRRGARSNNAKSDGTGKKNSGKATHRSSVFRGSPAPGKDNLPQELLLALEEEETPPTSPSSTRKKKTLPKNHLDREVSAATNYSLERQIDTVLQDNMMLNMDDYLRKSYDLGQVFR